MDKREWFRQWTVAGTLALVGVLLAGILAMSVDAATAATEPTFLDPTVTLVNRASVQFGSLDYVGPFAVLRAGTDAAHSITIGNESNVQDSVVVDATNGAIALGEMAILAHGSTVKGNSKIGMTGTCPDTAHGCPSFVGFNSEVDGAIVEKDAMVTHLARVAPGVTIPSGRKVLPGKNIASNAEVMAKTAPLVQGDREFMNGVIEVNVAFAREYTKLAAEDATNVRGINYDPGNTAFNPTRDLPRLAGKETRDPQFPNRIIGGVDLRDDQATLSRVMGVQVSLRADEGEKFAVGSVQSLGNNTTFHALEHTNIQLGNGGTYGTHSLVHGGPTPYKDTTISGDNFKLGDGAVFFRSRAGNNCVIGERSFVQESDLPDGTIVPPRTVLIGGRNAGSVEWDLAGAPALPAPALVPAATAVPTIVMPTSAPAPSAPMPLLPAPDFLPRRLGAG